jgi:hypothetical protein
MRPIHRSSPILLTHIQRFAKTLSVPEEVARGHARVFKGEECTERKGESAERRGKRSGVSHL